MAVGEALLLYVLLLLSCLAQGEYTPLYGKGHEASYTGECTTVGVCVGQIIRSYIIHGMCV